MCAGFVPEMRLHSLHPSSVLLNNSQVDMSAGSYNFSAIKWDEEISVDKALVLLGQGFYPFKKVLNTCRASHSQSTPFPYLHCWSDSVSVLHQCHGLGSSAREVGPLHPPVGCSGRPIMLRFGADTPGWSPGVFARYHGA